MRFADWKASMNVCLSTRRDYDVMSSAEARVMAADKPLSFLHGLGAFPLTDLFAVQKCTVEAAKILQLYFGRDDLQHAVIAGDSVLRHDDAAVLLPPDVHTLHFFVFELLP